MEKLFAFFFVDNYRQYDLKYATNVYATLGTILFLALFCIVLALYFCFIEQFFLAFLNVCFLFLLGLVIVLIRTSHIQIAVTLLSLELIAHSTFFSLLIGWDSGFVLFTLLAVLPHFLFFQSIRVEKAVISTAAFTAFNFCFFSRCLFPAPYAFLCTSILSLVLMNIFFFFVIFELVMHNYAGAFAARQLERLKQHASQDSLTGLYNRRYAETLFPSLGQGGVPFSLALVDIDFFKQVNDTYGHAAGDLVLRSFAQLLQSSFRASDLLVRWGGEEFLIIVSNISPQRMVVLLENLRRKTEEMEILFHDTPLHITITAGIAHSGNSIKGVEALLAQADTRLYEGKHKGRNRICEE